MKYPDRGDGRKAHYGDAKQPVDTILEKGWAPHFYAGNVVKYLRRAKDPEHSLESARVYYKWLVNLSEKERTAPHGTKRDCLGAVCALVDLENELTSQEIANLHP